jgi:hypothetical protein
VKNNQTTHATARLTAGIFCSGGFPYKFKIYRQVFYLIFPMFYRFLPIVASTSFYFATFLFFSGTDSFKYDCNQKTRLTAGSCVHCRKFGNRRD